MKIFIAGANGLIGRHLKKHLIDQGHIVYSLVRKSKSEKDLTWDGKELNGEALKALGKSDVLINLCGRTVNCRYTAKNRKQILESRINSTRALGKALKKLNHRIPYWLNASTATIYQSSHTKMTEFNGIIGKGFSVDIATSWEAEHIKFAKYAKYNCDLRMAMVLAHDGEFVQITSKLIKFGLGGNQGTGQQFMSWIHIKDLCQAIDFIIDKNLTGPINLSSPNPMTNEEFMKEARYHFKSLSPVQVNHPKFMIHIGAFLMRTEAELPLKSRCVVPERLINLGFKFHYPHLKNALVKIAGDLYEK